MSNIVAFKPRPRPNRQDALSSLCLGVAQSRRLPDDVFWLKENAELLNILECTGQRVTPDALAPLAGF